MVELIPGGVLINSRLEELREKGNVFEDIRVSTVASLRILPEEWVKQIDAEIPIS
ncbi:MAG: hypothetical protein WDZ54_02700 [Sneathiella sp.]